MTIQLWRGDAQAVKQVTHVTPADVEAGDVFILTINRKDISYTALFALASDVVSGLKDAVNDSDIAEFDEVVATVGTVTVDDVVTSTYLILTSATAGKPFTVTAGTTDAGNLDVTISTTTGGDPGTNEKQLITPSGTPTSGTFALSFDGQTTAAIAYNASASTVQAALEALSNIASGDVAVTGGLAGPWTVEFKQAYVNTNVVLITGDGANLVGAPTITVVTITEGASSVNAVQRIDFTSKGLTDTFTVTWKSPSNITSSSAAIYGSYAASQVQGALEAMSNISPGDVLVTAVSSKIVDVEFTGAYAGTVVNLMSGPVPITIQAIGNPTGVNESQVVTVNHGPTGGTYTLTYSAQTTAGIAYNATKYDVQDALVLLSNIAGTHEVQTLTQTGTPTGGTFTATLNAEATAAIAYDASAADIQTALEALASVTVGDVVCAGGPINTTPVTVSFEDALGYQEITEMTTDGALLTGGASPAVTAAETTPHVVADVGVTGDDGGPYTITFQNVLGSTDVSQLTASAASLTGSAVYSATTQAAVVVTDEVQQVSLVGLPAGGTFTLTLDAQTTAAIAFDASNYDVRDALVLLSNIAGANEVQTLTQTGSPAGGTFTLSYGGDTTAAIAYNASAATIQAALELLSTIGTGGVSCGGGAIDTTPVTVEFKQALGVTDVNIITADSASLTGGTTPTVTPSETTPGAASDVDVAGPAGGPWTVAFQDALGGIDVAAMTGDGANLTGPSAQTFIVSASVSATGPNHWDEPENWTGNAVPINGDDVYFEDNESDCLYGLDQSAVTLTSLNIAASYTGKIGLAVVNDDYYEYRDLYLQVGATNVNVGAGEGGGSGRFKIDTGAVQTTLLITDSGSGEDADLPSILWKGTHASNVARVFKGSLGVAVFAGEVATLTILQVGYQTDVFSDSDVQCGAGCTLTTVEQSGGSVAINSAAVTIIQTAGELTIDGSGAITTLSMRGGTCWYNSSGTLGTASISKDAVLDFNQDMRDKVVTNPIEIFGDAEFRDKFQVLGAIVIDANQTGGDLGRYQLGDNIRITRGTPA